MKHRDDVERHGYPCPACVITYPDEVGLLGHQKANHLDDLLTDPRHRDSSKGGN